MNRRASCVGTFEVFEAAHVALRTLLAFSQPVNCIFWPIGMLNWLVAASKLHKHRETCCTAEWPFYSFLILCHVYLCKLTGIQILSLRIVYPISLHILLLSLHKLIITAYTLKLGGDAVTTVKQTRTCRVYALMIVCMLAYYINQN